MMSIRKTVTAVGIIVLAQTGYGQDLEGAVELDSLAARVDSLTMRIAGLEDQIQAQSQDSRVEMKFNPYVKTVGTVNEGLMELGIWGLAKEGENGGRAYGNTALRFPLTDKKANVVQIDRNTTDWSWIFEVGKRGALGCEDWAFYLQYELGAKEFTYYPTALKQDERKERHTSTALELKLEKWNDCGCDTGRIAFSPQLRVRFDDQYESSEEMGVVRPPDTTASFAVVENYILNPPSRSNSFQPALALNLYCDNRAFSFASVFYYSRARVFKEPSNEIKEFSRLELWTYYYPPATNQMSSAQSRIGVAPFLLLPMLGYADKTSLYGGLFTIQFNVTKRKFF